VRKFLVVALMGALLLAGCGDDDGSETEVGGGSATTADGGDHGGHGGEDEAQCSPSGTTLSIVASRIKFDKDCLAVPAGQAFTLAFENKEAVPHSIVFKTSHESTDSLFPASETFTGPRTITVNAPPQQTGTYHFHCTVHPDAMQGTFVVA
jgi:plastocyanin